MTKKGQCWKCKKVGNLNYQTGEERYDGDSLLYSYRCPDCGAEGEEVYNLEFVGNREKRLEIGTKISFNIGNGLDIGEGIIRNYMYEVDDSSLTYQIEVTKGSNALMHRNKERELWVGSFEVKET